MKLSWMFDKDQAFYMLSSMIPQERVWVGHVRWVGGIPDWSLKSLWYVIIYMCAEYQISSMVKSVLRSTHPRIHTWRTLKVTDWSGAWESLKFPTSAFHWTKTSNHDLVFFFMNYCHNYFFSLETFWVSLENLL